MSINLEFIKADWVQTVDGFAIQLFVKNKYAAVEFIKNMVNGKLYISTLKLAHKSRSLDANAYFWVLCDKLAATLKIAKTEVYRNAIRDIGGNCDTVCLLTKAVDKFVSSWEKNGLGWFCETFDSKIDNCTNITVYYGSSTYDTAQMARLIENIVQDCKAVGIETATPSELARIMNEGI